MAVTVLHNGSPGYSTLPATAGALIALLDQLLVTVCGWTKPYTGTNLAAYLSPAGRYLRVDDTAASLARIVGYRTMTGISAGTGAFPSSAQASAGLCVDKGSDWRFICNPAYGCYLIVKTSSGYLAPVIFTDFISRKAGDAYNSIIGANASVNDVNCWGAVALRAEYLSNNQTGHYLAGPYTQSATSTACGKLTLIGNASVSYTIGASGSAAASAIDGDYSFSRILINDPSAGQIRGHLPGVWAPAHTRPFADLDTFSGSVDLAGRTFIAVNVGGAAAGQMIFETSDTWGI